MPVDSIGSFQEISFVNCIQNFLEDKILQPNYTPYCPIKNFPNQIQILNFGIYPDSSKHLYNCYGQGIARWKSPTQKQKKTSCKDISWNQIGVFKGFGEIAVH